MDKPVILIIDDNAYPGPSPNLLIARGHTTLTVAKAARQMSPVSTCSPPFPPNIRLDDDE